MTVELLQKWLSQCTADPSLECEARFCSRYPDSNNLKSGLHPSTYYRVLKGYQAFNWPSHQSESVDAIISSKKINCRLSFPELSAFHAFLKGAAEPSQCCQKQRIDSFDDLEYNVKYSLASERQQPWNELRPQLPSDLLFQLIRWKKRTVLFYKDYLKYDFTVAHTYKHHQGRLEPVGQFHEIEIEFLQMPQDRSIEDVAKSIHRQIQTMLQFIQDAKYLTTHSENLSIKNELAQFCTGPLVGPQPETLQQSHVSKIMSRSFAVTPKLDGLRRLLFIDSRGTLFLIDRNQKITKVGRSAPDDGIVHSILDGELVSKTFHAFDILFHNGTDLRDNIRMGLKERLSLLHALLPKIKPSTSDLVLKLKPHHIDDKIMFLESFSENSSEFDGLIFTPIHEPLPSKTRWPNLLKWKNKDHLTIDFMVSNNGVLNVTDGNNLIPFEPCSKLMSGNPAPGTIVECAWDFDRKGWIILKQRFDKVKPNFKTVALEVWQAIQHPVELSDLRGNHFSDLRNFHNRIKSNILQQIIQNGSHVLDLCCGRGSDAHKYKDPKIAGVLAVDIDEASIQQALARHPNESKIKFITGDLNKHETWDRISGQYDVIVCHFAIHYFCQSLEHITSFAQRIASHLKENGVFISTFLDGDVVLKYIFDIQSQRKKNVFNGHTFNITLHQDHLQKKLSELHAFGIQLDVQMVGEKTNYLNKPSNEFLVYPDLLCNVFDHHDLICESSWSFSQLFNPELDKLDDAEKEYSFLNRLVTFRKTKTAIAHINQFIHNNNLSHIISIAQNALGPFTAQMFEFDSFQRFISQHLQQHISDFSSDENMRSKIAKLSSLSNLIVLVINSTNDSLVDLYMHLPLQALDFGIIVFLDSENLLQLLLFNGSPFVSKDILIEMSSQTYEGPLPEMLNQMCPNKGPTTQSLEASPLDPPTPTPTPTTTTDQDTSPENDFYLGRPINHGPRGFRWSLDEIKDLVKNNNIKMPSSLRKKEEMIEFLKQKHPQLKA